MILERAQMRPSPIYFAIIIMLFSTPIMAQDSACAPKNIPCIQHQIASTVSTIDQPRWKNQALRDLAVSTAFNGDIDTAMTYVTVTLRR
jgi:hypothetical protein